MGLLDDAIREHLDLKRRRGADPAEVQQAEREALGPVRRNRDPSESLDSDPSLAELPEDAPAFDSEHDDGGWDQEPQGSAPAAVEPRPDVVGPPVFDDAAPVAPTGDPAAYDDASHFAEESGYPDEPADVRASAAYADEVAYADEPVARGGEEDDRSWSAADELEASFPTAPAPAPRAPDPAPRAPDPVQRSSDPVGEETTEYHIEERLPHDDEDADDDVLEETPEFLQDTPDHDRLWFEQRPPRDFDFDG